jgi:GntR family transcriptional regulator / MocR family aminotransferase
MQALAPDHVVYAGTTSKSLVPGLRLGWLVVPERALDAVIAAKEAAGASCSTLEQLALAELITSGQYDRQIRQARLAYRRRRDRLTAALAARQVPVAGIAAGLQALVTLREGQTEDHVVTRAREHGLSLFGLDRYSFPGHRHPAAVVVGYARPPEHAFTAALARLAQVLG